MELAAIILAAGKGTRMASPLPKVLHEVGQAPMIAHVIALAREAGIGRLVAVVGHEAAQVAAAVRALYDEAFIATQDRQLGTGHAVLEALPALKGHGGDVVVLYGDTPFITPASLAAMAGRRARGDAVVVLGFETADPGSYGRLILNAEGGLERIVEAREASAAERKITLCNSGVVMAPAALLAELLPGLGNDNDKREFYLTDIVALARARNLPCGMVRCPEEECLGVDSVAALARAEMVFQARARARAAAGGVRLLAPDTVFFAQDTVIGPGTVVEPNVVFGPGVTIENEARIRAFSHLEGAHVAEGAIIGPYARLRPGAEIGPAAHVGNFVEIKNAVLDKGAKANHLTYVGDALVGEGTNLGAGTITCNYDGVNKHRTEIGAGVFVGSNTALVAPVAVGAGAVIGAGSVITEDIAPGALAIARARQVTKPGLGARMMEMLRAARRK